LFCLFPKNKLPGGLDGAAREGRAARTKMGKGAAAAARATAHALSTRTRSEQAGRTRGGGERGGEEERGHLRLSPSFSERKRRKSSGGRHKRRHTSRQKRREGTRGERSGHLGNRRQESRVPHRPADAAGMKRASEGAGVRGGWAHAGDSLVGGRGASEGD